MNKNIKYLRFEKNLGQPHVMYNSDVLRKINGDLFFFLDSDDLLLPNSLRIIVEDFEYYKKYFVYLYFIMIESIQGNITHVNFTSNIKILIIN